MLGRLGERLHLVLYDKRGTRLQPSEHQTHQFLHTQVAMTAGDLLVQMPPDPFKGIRGRGRCGEGGQLDGLPPPIEQLLHGVARMTAGVVTNDVNFAGAQQETA